MPKAITIYTCTKCDAQFPKWEGRCRECGGWGTLKEAVVTKQRSVPAPTIVDFSSVQASTTTGILPTGYAEFDRVLGGGLVPGALILLGGDPGIGKSTLLLQTANQLAKSTNETVLYISGEESAEQVKGRLDRLGAPAPTLRFLGDPAIESITQGIEQLRPRLAIVDSLQTITSHTNPGNGRVKQLQAATEELMRVAKQTGVPILLIGHVTKQGAVAGPKTLEHLVDVVLYFEQGEHGPYRILRSVKNRFGSIQEIGVWQMAQGGLEEVANPAGTFLHERRSDAPGSAITALLQGSRVFLIEIQALVAKTQFKYPQRRASGIDLNRLQLIIAVLSKRLGLPLNYADVHVNVIGGIRANEPSIDLAIALAIASAVKNVALPTDLVAIGEIGLQGEVRKVNELERRLETAGRLGFSTVLTPAQDATVPQSVNNHYATSDVREAFEIVFPR